MAKNQIDFLNDILVKVRDDAGDLTRKSNITAREENTPAGSTTFTIESVKELFAGDQVYLFDGTVNSKFYQIASVNESLKKIVIEGDIEIAIGGKLVKTDALIHLNDALSVYSKFRPVQKKFEIEGDGNSVFELPDTWNPYSNEIVSIEYPEGNNPAEFIDAHSYKVILNNDNAWVISFDFPLSSGYTAVLNYNDIHSFNGDNPAVVTAPDSDFNAISNLASAKYLFAQAAFHGQSMNSTLSADVVNYDTKTQTYINIASSYLGQAASQLGLTAQELDGRYVEKAKTRIFKLKR